MSTKDIPEHHKPSPPLGLGSSEGLGVAEYRERLTDQAMQVVEMDAEGDLLGRAAHCLRLEVLRLRGVVYAGRTLTNGEAVRIPTSESEAALMVVLGTNYLREHAPHRLTAETPNA